MNWIIMGELAILILLTWRNGRLLGAISHNIHLLNPNADDGEK